MAINLGVFFGGSSVEHEISIISALQAIHSLDCEKYNVYPIYISVDGEFYFSNDLKDIENYENIDKLLEKCEQVAIIKKGKSVLGIRTAPKAFKSNTLFELDVALPIVHGTNCEDGSLQGLFELLRLPYVGCDVLSSAIGMDKVVMKQVLAKSDIPVVDYLSFYKSEYFEDEKTHISHIENKLAYPLIVKPANLGSSIGISKVSNQCELSNAIELAFSFAKKIIIEKAVENLREINCSVLGDYEECFTSSCEEPVGGDKILSYDDKYANQGSKDSQGMASLKRIIPAPITEEQTKTVEKLAVDTFKALCSSGVVRIDFLLNDKTGEIFVNEINTIPGSLSFYLWENCKKSYRVLLDDIIALAIKRERENSSIMYSYGGNVFKSGKFKKGSLSGTKTKV